MSFKENIAIIGSGNVGWHLAHTFHKAGHQVRYIVSRNVESARDLENNIPGLEITSSLNLSLKNFSLVILAVPDAAIEEIAAKILIPETAILIHTSGSYKLNRLDFTAFSTGVFYPLQTFTRGRSIDFTEVPVLIEASDEVALVKLKKLAESISKKVLVYDSEMRQKIHIAAVFASNFTNHLLHLSKIILEKEKIDLTILKELVFETIKKSFEIGPSAAQTGPAKRGDRETIENHLKILDYEPKIQEIYNMLTKNINQINN
ncbi:DUF2520 domain-containing protein [soil metagenome]